MKTKLNDTQQQTELSQADMDAISVISLQFLMAVMSGN